MLLFQGRLNLVFPFICKGCRCFYQHVLSTLKVVSKKIEPPPALEIQGLKAVSINTFCPIGLNIYGVRKAEGGARKNAYKTCFSLGDNGIDEYRPIFWYLSDTKKLYKEHYKINYSNCYKEYGLKRTGCAGCPYSKKFEEELNAMEKFEPHLYRAVNNIFKESYLYTREYRKFVCKKRREGGITNE